MRPNILAPILLACLVTGIYYRVIGNEFVNFDDPLCVTENPMVLGGLTWKGIGWAFTTGHFANWMPLTWLSHMADCQWFGLHSGSHHAVSVVLHLAASVALYFALAELSKSPWPSLLVAALYAAHPLHVESVAWIAERKGVLSDGFWMLTMWTYAKYARSLSLGWYLATCVVFLLGLMAKQMLVTLPFALLLLDWWPLARSNWKRAILEKLPLIAIAVLFAMIAFRAQNAGGAIGTTIEMPITVRLSNAVVSPVRYLAKALWPTKLSVFYPHPGDSLTAVELEISSAMLVTLSGAAVAFRRAHPYWIMGWTWYLGTLAPVIGFMPIGRHGMADRYTDIPMVGIDIAVAWTAVAIASRAAIFRAAVLVVGTSAILALSCLSWAQVGVWRNSRTLFEHVLTVDPDNYMAHNQVGTLCMERGDVVQAAAHFEKAVHADPSFSIASFNLGLALTRLGKFDEAIDAFRLSIQADPGKARDWFHPDVDLQTGMRSQANGQIEQAIGSYAKAAARLPADPVVNYRLGVAYALAKDPIRSLRYLRISRDSAPDWWAPTIDLAWILATSPVDSARDGAQAIALVKGLESTPLIKDPRFHDVLAAAEARTGAFERAVIHARSALDLAKSDGWAKLRPGIEDRLASYQKRVAWRDASGRTPSTETPDPSPPGGR